MRWGSMHPGCRRHSKDLSSRGMITEEAAAITGLKAGTPVAAGGGDQAAQAVGVGAVEPGVVALTVGTSGVVFATTPSALIEPEGRLHAFCHAVPGMWHFMGVMLSAAGSLQWYRDTLAPGMSFDELLKEAESVPAGSEGLQFLPYLSGERTPYPDPLARAAFIGLTLRHGRGHMTRAVLEGVSFGLKDSFTLIQNAGLGEITQVRASGGGTKGRCGDRSWLPYWKRNWSRSIQPRERHSARLLLAGVGAGIWPDVASASDMAVKLTGSTMPDPAQIDAYREAYPLYQGLYPALKPSFSKM